MSANPSRRALARYAVDQLLAGDKPAKISQQLAASLIAAGRQNQGNLLLSDIAEELENRGLLAQAVLTSATNLSASFKKQLASQLKRSVGVKDIILDEQIDASVIGGFKVSTANHSWNKTIARKLADIKGTI